MRLRKTLKSALILSSFFIMITQSATAQGQQDKKPEILICGTIHHIPDSVNQNWNGYRKFLRDFRPDAICVEYRMPGDSISLMHADGERYQQIADSLATVWNTDTLNANKRIKDLYAALRLNDDWEKRIELFQLLYLEADFGNANFQAWQAYKLVSILPDDKKKEIRTRYPAYKRMESIVKAIKNNEYSNVVFPLAVEFKIDYLYPVDDWTYNRRFSIAYMEAYEELEGTKFENKAKTFWEEFTKIESGEIAKGNGLMFVNSAAWQKKADYAQTGLYLSSGNIHHKDYVKYWNERNKKVGINILDQVKGKEYKRVAVFMGYLHIPNMKKYMKKEKSILLKTMSDY